MSAAPKRPVPRLALTPEEAAESIGVSRAFFYEHVLRELRVVRVGRRRIVPVAALEEYLGREARRVLD
jgi:excisionase family DNA binding protein